MNNRLCLFHVPKTGGTSLRRSLVDALGQDKCFPSEGNMRGGVYFNSNRFSELPPGQRAKIRLVSGHFAIDHLRDLEGFRVCAVLREPRERAVSVVRHFMRNDPRYAGLPFREVLEAVALAQVHDFYHKRFSGIRYDTGAPSTALALEGLDRIDFLGFYDQLEPFCHRVAREVFGLDITLGWLNAAPSDFIPDPADQAHIDELTRRDLVFYSAAVAARAELSSASGQTAAGSTGPVTARRSNFASS